MRYDLCRFTTQLKLIITQYGSTAYLGMARVVSGQFQHFENTRHSITDEHDSEELK